MLAVNPISFSKGNYRQNFKGVQSSVNDVAKKIVGELPESPLKKGDVFQKLADNIEKKPATYNDRYEQAVKKPDFFEM